MAENLKRTVLENANGNVHECSELLVMRELQIKITVLYYYTSSRIVKI